LEDPGIDKRIILRGISGSGWGDELVDLAQDKYRWRTLEIAVMNFWIL
jgi:hypothetical protein